MTFHPRTLAPAEEMRFGAGLVVQPFVAAALVVTLVGVWPTALWLVKRRPVTLAQSLLFGLAFGNVPVALGGTSAGFHGLSGAFRAIAFASVIGITGAAVFWVISLRTAGYNGPTPRRFGSRHVERNQ